MTGSNDSGPIEPAGGHDPPAEWNDPDARGDNLAGVEALLRAIPLRRPGPALDGRVRRALRRGPGWPAHARTPCLAAAAVLAVAAGVAPLIFRAARQTDTQPPLTGGPQPTPVVPLAIHPHTADTIRAALAAGPPLRVERTVARVTDDGVVGRLDDAPLVRYRRQSVRQVWLVDPQHGPRLTTTVPREEVVVVRVRPF